MKKKLGPTTAFFPIPAALIASRAGDKINIITVSWIGIVGQTPPMIGISLRKDRYSLELIRKSKEFTTNIPSADLFREVDYCGLVSGRKHDKFKDLNLTPVDGTKVSAPIIKECPYNMECVVKQEIVLGDWVLILAEIVETHLDEDKVDPSNRANINILKVNPLVYCAEVRKYWSLGKKLGNGFSSGKEIMDRIKEKDGDG